MHKSEVALQECRPQHEGAKRIRLSNCGIWFNFKLVSQLKHTEISFLQMSTKEEVDVWISSYTM